MNPIARFRSCFSVLCLMVCCPVAAQDSKPFFEIDGPLLEAGKHNLYYTLEAVGPNLVCKYEDSYAQANAASNEVRRAFGGSGGSSSSGDRWRIYFRGAQGFGEVGIGNWNSRVTGRLPEQQNNDFHLTMLESNGARRQVKVEADEDGAFLITIRSQNPEAVFRFKKRADNRIVCQEFSRDVAFAAEAASFDEFCNDQLDYVENRLFPIFRFLGVGEPVTRFSPEVQQFVIRKLTPPSAQRVERFKNAIRELDQDDFETREQATEELKSQFAQWRQLIQLAISDSQYPIEIRSRLKRIYEEAVSRSEREHVELADQSALHEDPEYLVWLWGQIESEGQRESEEQPELAEQPELEEQPESDHRIESERQPDIEQTVKQIASQLEKVTGESLGADRLRWVQWQARSQSEDEDQGEPRPNPADYFLSELGPLDLANESIGQLLKFKLEDGRLVLDESHWAEPFGGKTVAESVADVRELMRERNLPEDWFDSGGGYTMESTGYPQVLFERMKSVYGEDQESPANWHYYAHLAKELDSKNRGFTTESLEARLEFHDATPHENMIRFRVGGNIVGKAGKPSPEYFRLYVSERASPRRTLEIQIARDGTLTMELLAADSDATLRLTQYPGDDGGQGGCRVVEVVGGKMITLQASRFTALLESDHEYLSERWISVFEKLGVQFDLAFRGE